MAIRARARRVTGVVRVEEVDPAHDREHALDGVRELLTRCVRVAGVEAKADLHLRLRPSHRVPEARERVEAARHGVVAAGEELDGAVARVLAIVGRIDLLHANDSRDPPGTGADRHANLGKGEIGAEVLRAMFKAAGPPVVVETPGGAKEMRADIEFVRESLG